MKPLSLSWFTHQLLQVAKQTTKKLTAVVFFNKEVTQQGQKEMKILFFLWNPESHPKTTEMVQCLRETLCIILFSGNIDYSAGWKMSLSLRLSGLLFLLPLPSISIVLELPKEKF